MANTLLISPQHGRFYFDAVFKTEHKKELSVTAHPIQSGSSIVDHSYFEPDELTLEIGFSDAMAEMGEANHSVNAFSQLETIMQEREPITVVTRFKLYTDMLIISMVIPDEYGMMYGMKASITLKKVEIVYAQIVTVQNKVKSSKGGGNNNNRQDKTDDAESVEEVDNRSLLMYALQEYLGIDTSKFSWYSSSKTTQETDNNKTTGSGK